MARRHVHVVVDFGPSSHDNDTYYLIRVFSSNENRHQALEDLYGSEEWLRDCNEVVMAFIESYQTAVIRTSSEAVDRLIEASRHV